jgi:hypothetical protein
MSTHASQGVSLYKALVLSLHLGCDWSVIRTP